VPQKGGSNFCICRLKKPSPDARRERETPAYLDKIRKLPCCIPSCNEPAPSHAHHLKCLGAKHHQAKSYGVCASDCHYFLGGTTLPSSLKVMPAASKVWRNTTSVAGTGADCPVSNLLIVVTPILDLADNSRTPQARAARAIRHCVAVIIE
jgi:hypothetical protein